MLGQENGNDRLHPIEAKSLGRFVADDVGDAPRAFGRSYRASSGGGILAFLSRGFLFAIISLLKSASRNLKNVARMTFYNGLLAIIRSNGGLSDNTGCTPRQTYRAACVLHER